MSDHDPPQTCNQVHETVPPMRTPGQKMTVVARQGGGGAGRHGLGPQEPEKSILGRPKGEGPTVPSHFTQKCKSRDRIIKNFMTATAEL